MADSRDAAVARHYESYPYPARDPADEAKRLIEGSPSRLPELAHYLFRGAAPSPFRALAAGGGSGDGAIMLAQHMADAGLDGEVVWLDMSAAARAVAEARVRARGLTNIRFVSGSLLEARALVGDGFDYVDCCGVLHHLDAPEAGIAALRGVLADHGGMGIMVYGALGRRGVYDFQDAAAMLAPQADAPSERLALGRRLFADLPASNWLKRNPFVRDHLDGGDAGFYDLLMHARDRAYTVGELAALAASAGLSIVTFVEPVFYDPATYLKDPTLKAAAAMLAPLDRAALAERLSGGLTKHVAYLAPAARAATATATLDDGALRPVLRDGNGPAIAEAARRGPLKLRHLGADIARPLPRLAPAILRRIDGRARIDDIYRDISAADPGLDRRRFDAAFGEVCAALGGLNLLWLAR